MHCEALPNELLDLTAINCALAERSLAEFLRQAWAVIEPGTPYRENWHIACICEYLEAVHAGQIRRLLINEPPRSLKSVVVSVMWPVWCWLHAPESRWMFASYSQSLSTFHSVLRRTLLQSGWFRTRWGGRFRLSPAQNLKMEFANDHLGMMIATSVGGTSIGKGGDYLVFDDPLNPTEAASPVQRESANSWIRQGFLTRLNDKKTGRIVGVMQRLHEQDTSGMLLAMGGWTHLCLPAEAEERTVIHFPISGRDVVREPGALLFPEREGAEELARRKIELGSYAYAGQYQQRPSPEEGGLLKRHWWKFWYPRNMTPPTVVTAKRADGELVECAQVALPEKFDEQLLSWDMTFKDTAGSDFVVGQAWARYGAQKFLLGQQRAQADLPATIKLVVRMVQQYPEATAVLIEDKANGPAVLQVLRREVSGLIAVNPQGGKVARINAVAPMIEAGDVYLPHPALAPWVWEFIERAAAFPNATHDDEEDAMSQALLRMKRHDVAWPEETLPEPTADEQWDATLRTLGVAPERHAMETGW